MGGAQTVTVPLEVSREAEARTRRMSLDVARGLMLVASVAVNAWFLAPDRLRHAAWDSVMPVDLIFPVFVTLSGCGLAFAYGRHVPVQPTVRRFLILLAAGFAYNAHNQYLTSRSLDLDIFRVTGVLQLYAVLVLLVALLHLVARSWWQWLLITAALATACTAVLHRFAMGCAEGALTPDCNPSGAVDPVVFGVQHIYSAGARGHDPEGLVVVAGALVSAAAGATIGHVLSTRSGLSGRRALLVLAGVVVCFVLGAHLSGELVPAMKRLWTPPFALLTAAGVAAVLAVLHVVLDARRPRRWVRAVAYPLVALGRNSLLVYFGSHVLMLTLVLSVSPSGESWALTLARAVGGGPDRLWPFIVASVVAWTAAASLLHSRRIYLRP